MSDAPSKIIPNSYQSPNFLVDDLMRFLSGNEHKCADVVCRKTFGWHKRSDRISKSQLMELTGLGENAIDECMAELVKYRVVLRVSESLENKGVEWSIQTDDAQIDMAGLKDRDTKRRQLNRSRVAAAQAKRQGGDVGHTPHVGHTPGGDVGRPPQKPLSKDNLIVIKGDGDIFRLYEQEIGTLTPLIADALKDAEQTYPPDWIPEAIQIAVENNKRNWKYVEAILKNCQEKGIRPSLNRLEKNNGHNGTGNQKRTGTRPKAEPHEYTDADYAAAEEINRMQSLR